MWGERVIFVSSMNCRCLMRYKRLNILDFVLYFYFALSLFMALDILFSTLLDIALSDKSLSMTCGRSVVFSWYLGFLHQYNWPPQYTGSLNVECGVKHNNPNPYFALSLCLIYIHGIRYFFCTFTLAYLCLWPPWTPQSLTINNIQIVK